MVLVPDPPAIQSDPFQVRLLTPVLNKDPPVPARTGVQRMPFVE